MHKYCTIVAMYFTVYGSRILKLLYVYIRIKKVSKYSIDNEDHIFHYQKKKF